MPNHVQNRLTILGPARDIATFVLRSQIPRPHTGDKPFHPDGRENLNYTVQRENPPRIAFDFHGVVPLPAAYAQVAYDTGREGGPSGYTMEYDTWGVKWGPYRCNPATDIVIAEHRATYTFVTAWSLPTRYYEQASLQFSACLFLISWGGEGPCFGRGMLRAGTWLDWLDGDPDTLPSYDEEDEGTAYNDAVEHYLLTHETWVQEVTHAPQEHQAGQEECDAL